ncbi:MAG: hypothetical protein GC160_25785 [Acidobacteria bacterium]|nr:hypothetical protein [Acidobacteriota bacterium]
MLSRCIACAIVLVACVGWALDRPASLIDESRILPSEHPAIDYWRADPNDAVARLQRRLSGGEIQLSFDERFGYLPAVLDALDVPRSSQVLVFSKTSFQASRIFPRVPRALYHNEEVSVGWVDGGDVVEIASLDPKLGVVFYTLPQEQTRRPQFAPRTTECISCHAGSYTLGVPGLLVRSVHPDQSGTPQRTPSFITDHRSPLSERWGGWYVSGRHGSQRHMGNATYERDQSALPLIGSQTQNVAKLQPYVSPYNYLRSTSDIVSLMTLEHQTRMTNLITRLGYVARIAERDGVTPEARREIENTAEELLRYLLFTDEAPLEAPVEGDPEYAEAFEARGPRDSQGRSLHQLDLQTRLLRYPCSYMIDSEAMESLPAVAKDRVYRRLWEVLTGRDESPAFGSLGKEDRRAIHEILAGTKKDLPEYW